MRAAESMRWRRRASPTSVRSNMAPRGDATLHQRDAISDGERSAMRRTTRRITKPDRRVKITAPTKRAITTDAVTDPPSSQKSWSQYARPANRFVAILANYYDYVTKLQSIGQITCVKH